MTAKKNFLPSHTQGRPRPVDEESAVAGVSRLLGRKCRCLEVLPGQFKGAFLLLAIRPSKPASMVERLMVADWAIEHDVVIALV